VFRVRGGGSRFFGIRVVVGVRFRSEAPRSSFSVLACGRGENHVDSGNVAGSIGATANQQPY
jgi:hypothetical protein